MGTYGYLIPFLDALKLVGHNIRKFRKTKEWSIEALAEHADISPAYLGELERGRENVSIRTLSQIAKALRVKLPSLLDEERPAETPIK
jgi:transcriptional regulator with XRE-family HTH domain